ncbi:MAG: Ig-like domain-containing protein [Deltaproteobacteria bacterium]|nr:Ig-like domain-containing protein [Deltaproteobacteria bacterium]
MRRLAFFLTVFVGLGPAAAFAQGFKLLDMNPRLSHFETTPDEDVTLLFNTSLDASTVNDTNIYLERLDTAEIVSASLVLGSANISNDLVTIDPDADLRFGKKYRVVIEPALKNTGGQSFNGVFPGGFDWFVPNRPLDFDRPVWDPQDFTSFFVNANVLLGFNPVDAEATNPNRPETIPGINATGAWKISTGRPEIIIADIDNGLSNFHNRDLADRLFLNAGELPPPQDGADPCDYDCNGDGRFSASDYGNDPRVDDGGRGYIDPQGLIDAFADDIDGDGNGFVDDISGWDFFRDTNTPIGVSQFEEGTHSNLVSTAAGAQADNGFGEKPGVCPDCTTMVLRVTDAVIGDLDAMAAAAEYAVAMGARVLMIPLGSFDYSAGGDRRFSGRVRGGGR